VSNASHAPFITSVGHQFFHCKSIAELAAIRDLTAHMDHPRFSKWQALRASPEAAYIGLALPRYILRLPYDPENNPSTLPIHYSEKIRNGDLAEDEDYLWGNAAVLVAKNLVRSFEEAGWCQSIRGPEGGGLVSGLPVHTFNVRGEAELKIPVELQIPDFRELDFAKCGLMPLVYKKGTGVACFFSAQSIKLPKHMMDPKDQENSQLVTNLAYTFSITRLAHYIKSMMRDKIGTTADAAYIQTYLTDWLMRYVTEVSNPDDLTLRSYPFKAATIVVTEQEGEIGWYDCKLAVKPHIQFEGMDVELRLEARL
jgi:type VI secretion system protein ImpC